MDHLKRSRSRNLVNDNSEMDLDVGSNTRSLDSSIDNIGGSQDTVVFDSTLSLYRSNQFELYLMGMIQDVNLSSLQRDPDVQLIDRIEEAQLAGKVQMFPKDENLVTLVISKHGVKVMNHSKKEVLHRHALHTVGQIVYYNDSFFKSNLAIKIGLVGCTVYNCYIFQCYNEEQAQTICQCLKEVFDSISSRTR